MIEENRIKEFDFNFRNCFVVTDGYKRDDILFVDPVGKEIVYTLKNLKNNKHCVRNHKVKSFSHGGNSLICYGSPEGFYLLNLSNLEHFKLGKWIDGRGMDFFSNVNGTGILATCTSREIRLWDVSKKDLLPFSVKDGDNFRRVRFMDENHLLVSEQRFSTISKYDVVKEKRESIHVIKKDYLSSNFQGLSGNCFDLVNRDSIVVTVKDENILFLDCRSMKKIEDVTMPRKFEEISSLSDSYSFVVSTNFERGNEIYRCDIRKFQCPLKYSVQRGTERSGLPSVEYEGGIKSIVDLGHKRKFATLTRSGLIQTWDYENSSKVDTIQIHDFEGYGMDFISSESTLDRKTNSESGTTTEGRAWEKFLSENKKPSKEDNSNTPGTDLSDSEGGNLVKYKIVPVFDHVKKDFVEFSIPFTPGNFYPNRNTNTTVSDVLKGVLEYLKSNNSYNTMMKNISLDQLELCGIPNPNRLLFTKDFPKENGRIVGKVLSFPGKSVFPHYWAERFSKGIFLLNVLDKGSERYLDASSHSFNVIGGFSSPRREFSIWKKEDIFLKSFCDYRDDFKIMTKVGELYGPVLSIVENREMCLEIVKRNPLSLEYGSDAFKNDGEIVMEAVRRNGLTLQFVGRNLRNQKEVVLESVKQYHFALKYASNEMRNDRDIVLEAVKKEGACLRLASMELRNDREVVLEAVKTFGKALSFSDSETIKDDKEIVMIAVKNDSFAVSHASERLQNDIDVVRAVVERNGGHLQRVKNEDVFKDRSILITAVNPPQKSGLRTLYSLKFASEAVRNDKEIVLSSVGAPMGYFEYASQDLKNDKDFALKAIEVSKRSDVFKFVSQDLKNDKEVVLKAVKKDRSSFTYASQELRNNKDFVLEMVEKHDIQFHTWGSVKRG